MRMNFMNGLFGKVKPGMCRMSMEGKVAVNTSNGYKTYDVNTGTLVNCDDFVFDIGEEFFFLIPTNSVQTGDIILAGGKPCCVIKTEGNTIQVLRYEDSSISTIVPENHMFMGKTYFYGKIVSMFGGMMESGNTEDMMKYMMMASMMGGGNDTDSYRPVPKSGMQNMLPMMFMMNGGFNNMFNGMFGGNKPAAPTTTDVKEDK